MRKGVTCPEKLVHTQVRELGVDQVLGQGRDWSTGGWQALSFAISLVTTGGVGGWSAMYAA